MHLRDRELIPQESAAKFTLSTSQSTQNIVRLDFRMLSIMI
ncbi:MAG: hypothetical protein ACI9SX_000981 [Pseudoalteromonas tetraodonis]|jgi:hypothetical protein